MRFALLLFAFSHLADASLSLVELSAPAFPSHFTTLRAARRHREILERSDEIFVTREVELAYADASFGRPAFTSRLQCHTDRPTVLLENFDHLLEDVECTGSTMAVTVQGEGPYHKARAAWKSLEDGLLISSHYTCSDNGAHAVYRILGVNFDDEASLITFEIEESSLKEEIGSVTIEIGHSLDNYVVHQHDRLSRRTPQSPSQTISSPPASTTVVQPNDTYNALDLSFEQLDTTFTLGPGTEELNPIELGCKNCSAKGEMIITTGRFELDLGRPITGKDNDVVKSGFLQIDVKGFEVSIGLKALPSVPLARSFTAYEIVPPGLGFGIPKIGSFGITIGLDVTFDVKVSGGVELGFGFDVVVPDSVARLDVAELQDSKIEGFSDTKITAKPLQANASDLELSIVIGLRPRIDAGIKFLDGALSFTGGPYLTLPNFNMTLTQLTSANVGANCEPNGDTVDEFQDAFQNLTHVDYNLGIAAGLQAKLGIIPYSTDFISHQVPIATQCLVQQSSGTSTGLALATDVLESMTHTPTPSPGGGVKGSENGASRAFTPSSTLTGVLSMYCQAGLVTVGIVTAMFAVLL